MPSEVTGDRFEFGAVTLGAIDLKAMVDVVMDQHAFGIGDGLLNGLKLLRHVNAGFACLYHRDHRTQMPIGTFQPGNEGGMTCMNMGV
jgi:hypothetical protein